MRISYSWPGTRPHKLLQPEHYCCNFRLKRGLETSFPQVMQIQGYKIWNLLECTKELLPFPQLCDFIQTLVYRLVYHWCIRCSKSISNRVQYVTLQRIFLRSKLDIYFFPISPIKLKLGLQIARRLLIANHQNQSLWLANQEQGTTVRSYLLHSSMTGVRLCRAIYKPQQIMQKCWAKTVLLCNSWT